MRFGTVLFCLGLLVGICQSDWLQVPVAVICAEDVNLWPYTPALAFG